MARSQQPRPSERSFQSLVTDLSTGLPTDFQAHAAFRKQLTTSTRACLKTPDQKTTNALQATYLKAYSQLLPRYPQPVPQQTGTSQNRDKTTVCGDFMSRFGKGCGLLSTIIPPLSISPVGASLLAMAVGQAHGCRQVYRYREQARSHRVGRCSGEIKKPAITRRFFYCL